MKILIVDDNAQVRKMLCDYLKKNGHHAEMANDGKQGWELISNSRDAFDLVFSDIKMPTMNGLELLEKMKSNDIGIPVIIMTGYAVIELTLKAFKLGAFDFLTKPFEFEPLLTTLDKVDALKKRKREMNRISKYCETTVEFIIPSHLKFLKSLIPRLQNCYKPFCDLYHQDSNAIASCLRAAIENAIVLGNYELGSTSKISSSTKRDAMIKQKETIPKYVEREVMIRGTFNREKLKFEVRDQGRGFDFKSLPDFSDPENALLNGRGLHIIHSNMDTVEWNESGNHITMTKHMEQP